MKRKIEYLLLAAVIVLLGSYLYFKRTDQVHYQIPQLKAMDADAVTSIVVTSVGQSVTLNRKDRAWTIGTAGFPADRQKAQKMLHDVKTLTLTDLVSDSKNYSRYDLGENDRITVKAYAGSSLVRQFDVGKVASSNRQTYVMIPGDANVYQAKAGFREDFQGNVESFRDRKVLSFMMEDIRKVSISKGSASVALTRQVPGEKPGKPAVWVDGKGKEASKSDMDLLVSSLSSLECSEFLGDLKKTDLGSPAATVTLTGDREYSFSLYAKKGDKTPATSSGSGYVFGMQEYQREAIGKAIDKLVKAP
jgi:hypothetical protein